MRDREILLHRYPFLFVDRITEFEVDKRIVRIKNVSHNERYSPRQWTTGQRCRRPS
jgi:3-hydroxymyristoyl/3-hydroxydecanoyl-(acyl carrier protein) dehydratase